MKAHRFFVRLFISFTLLIVILISIIYLMSYRTMLKNSEGELGKSCINSLQMADTAIKQLKDSLYKDCVNLSLNKSVINMGSYLKTPYFMEPNEIVNLMQIFDLLNNLARTNDKIGRAHV